MQNVFSLNRQYLELNQEEKENSYVEGISCHSQGYRRLLDCYTRFDFSKEKYLPQRFVIIVCEVFLKLVFSFQEYCLLLGCCKCLYLYIVNLKNSGLFFFLSSRHQESFYYGYKNLVTYLSSCLFPVFQICKIRMFKRS